MLRIRQKPTHRKIPPYLVYEEINGQVLPYKGYLEVLSGKKKIEEIMGSSSLQAVIVSLLNAFLFNSINRKKYLIGTNEAGLHLQPGDNLANDLVIYDREKVVLNDKYFDKSPKVIVEVDIKIDLRATEWTNEWDYVIEKSQKMLDFGAEKVIWITTKSKKIFVSSSTERWYMVSFDEDIHLIENCTLNLARLLAEEEIEF
ncbi:MAG: Uma2 family endonuclease [Spirosomataceae bacterium]